MRYLISYEHRSSAYNPRVRFLILHYTAENFQVSLDLLTQKVSAHYLVPDPTDSSYPYQDLRIFNLVNENDRAWHAGKSFWEDRKNLNDNSIGIETVNQTYEEKGTTHFLPYNQKQVEAIIQLTQNILARYPDITATRVLGHSDIAPGRKTDPGPLFPWKQLYDAGVGAWYDEETRERYISQYTKQGLPSISAIQKQLRNYGYYIACTQTYSAQTQATLKAFQMHFRPSSYTGTLDIETAAILGALIEKYHL